MTPWLLGSAVLVLAIGWGLMERRVQLFRRGLIDPKLGYEMTGRTLMIGQAAVTLLLLAVLCLIAWMFGWKATAMATLASLVIAGLAS